MVMDSWKSENNPVKQLALAIVCVLIGLILTIACRNFSDPGITNSLAVFLLGLLLLIIGIYGLLVSGKQTIVIDPKTRCITIEDTNRLRTKKRSIPFNDIVDIKIGYLGKRSNFVEFYYLVLKLRSGEKYPLFSAGRFYEGGSNRAVVESWQQRLKEYLRQS
jgi:hypothetical protein